MAKGLFLLILLLVSSSSEAAKVVQINRNALFHLIIDNTQKPQVEMNNEMCVKFSDTRGLCGTVFALRGKFAAVRFQPGFAKITNRLNLPLEAFAPEVFRVSKIVLIRNWQKGPRGIANEDSITQFDGKQPWEKREKVGWPRAIDDGFHPTNHISLGVSYISPYMKYEVSVGRHWALGLKMEYAYLGIPGGTLSGYGGVFNVNYYSIREFKGLWIQFGTGFYSLQITKGIRSGTFSTPAIGFLAGWKWSWKNNFSFGFGFGTEFLFKTEPAGFTPSFSGALPVVLLDFGIVF